jgi:ribonuclease P protein component
MLGRLTRAADFERVLAMPARARSEHFAVHHLATSPTRPRRAQREAGFPMLSTDRRHTDKGAVDDLRDFGPIRDIWLGTVVPKRLARRAATRNLIKRHMRMCVQTHRGGLQGGLWVVRMKAPFEKSRFVSAASPVLGSAARTELDAMIGRLAGGSS